MALVITLAVLALLLAVLALLVAIRTERHLRRLAQALAREWGLRTGEPTQFAVHAPESVAAAEAQAQLRRSLEALEERVFELAARAAGQGAAGEGAAGEGAAGEGAAGERAGGPVGAGGVRRVARAGGAAEPRELVRQHLEALGYDAVVVLPGQGRSGAWLYEARAEGMPMKGAARVSADGLVVLSPAVALRAFP